METPAYDDIYSNNNDSDDDFAPCDRNSDNSLGAQLTIMYYFMFLFSLCGNVLVLVIIHRFEKLTTVTNILLLNLSLSSLIFMSSLPFMGLYMQLSNWIFGRAMCKIVYSVHFLGFSSSILFLTLLTFDRHLAVVYSLGASRVRNHGYAAISCAVVWLISSLACIKPMIVVDTYKSYASNNTYCNEYPGEMPNINMQHLMTAQFYIWLFLFYIFPLSVIIYCYLRITITVLSSKIVTKFKTVRLIFIIVLLFFFCWTPFIIVQLMSVEGCVQAQRMGYALHITRNIAYIYFCISPIFYTFVGKKFQNYFRQILVTHFPGLKRHISLSQNNSKNNLSTKTTPNDL